MSNISVEEFRKQITGSGDRFFQRLEKQLTAAALQMEGRSKDVQFSQFKNSRLRKGRGGGRLRQSIAGRFAIIDGMPTAILQAGGQFRGEEVFYAKFIEFGTRFIRPRKFLGRSIDIQQEKLNPKLKLLLKIAVLQAK
tara:strand:- start:128 stop:541 length:414 start_codon:yes stop_codon:yes gene_type:complete